MNGKILSTERLRREGKRAEDDRFGALDTSSLPVNRRRAYDGGTEQLWGLGMTQSNKRARILGIFMPNQNCPLHATRDRVKMRCCQTS